MNSPFWTKCESFLWFMILVLAVSLEVRHNAVHVCSAPTLLHEDFFPRKSVSWPLENHETALGLPCKDWDAGKSQNLASVSASVKS